jgi:hypothetical protein
MIKQRKLKKWVINTLVGINFISLLIMGSDSKDLSVFIIVHIIALVVFLLSGYILIKNERD